MRNARIDSVAHKRVSKKKQSTLHVPYEVLQRGSWSTFLLALPPTTGVKTTAMEMSPTFGEQNLNVGPMLPVFKYFWLLAIVCNVLNAVILRVRSKHYVQQRPELAGGYRKYFLGFLFWGSLPWIVMGVGIVFGGVPNVFSYFHPQDPNPFIRAWFGCIILMWLLGFYWIFARRGAEFLVEHPGLLSRNLDTPAKIKGFYCLTLVGGAVGLYFMFTNQIPTFNQ